MDAPVGDCHVVYDSSEFMFEYGLGERLLGTSSQIKYGHGNETNVRMIIGLAGY